MVIETFSPEQTNRVGFTLGELLKTGDVICLIGNLGAGKTAFTSGLAHALGVTGYITSPTFTLVNEYNGKIPLYHFDVYRIAEPEEMFEIGFDEYLYGSGIVVIEWADLIRDILPEEYIRVDIKKDLPNGIDKRILTLEFKGQRYVGYEKLMEERLN